MRDEDADRLEFESLHHPLFAADIVSGRLQPPAFLFSPILRSHTLTMISAEPFTGKTLLCLAMILSLDTGFPLLETFTPTSGHRCLFIGQDSPTWDIHGQFTKLFNGLGLSPQQKRDLSLPSIFLLNRGFSIVHPQFLVFLSQLVSLYGITVLFLDTLLDFHPLDENSNRDMSNVMRILKRARDELGLTIFFTHHTSKPPREASAVPQFSRTARARGASVLGGAIDQHAALDLVTRDAHGTTVALSFPKGRALEHSEAQNFTIYSPTSGCLMLRPSSLSLTSRLVDLLASPCSRQHLRQSLQVSDGALSHALASLKASGQIHSPSYGIWQRTDSRDTSSRTSGQLPQPEG